MVFKYSPAKAAEEFKERGFVHLKDILDDDFIAYLDAFYKDTQATHTKEKDEWQVYGKKRQYLFDFPSKEDAEEFREGMSQLLGYESENFTISERHLKVYDDNAKPWPAPHKDRAASFVSLGLPIHLPKGSSVCVFPELEFGPNEEERAVFLTDRDHPDLEHVYEKEEALLLNESVGDIVAFLGSSIFHERVNASGAAILYVKVNDDGRDPLGENIFAEGSEPEMA